MEYKTKFSKAQKSYKHILYTESFDIHILVIAWFWHGFCI